jgi:hypothetical protein
MTNYVYPEEFQDLPKNKNKAFVKPVPVGPSPMTMKFILGYGAALSVIKSNKIGNLKILLN